MRNWPLTGKEDNTEKIHGLLLANGFCSFGGFKTKGLRLAVASPENEFSFGLASKDGCKIGLAEKKETSESF